MLIDLAGVLGLDVGADGEVEVVFCDLLHAHRLGDVRDILLAVEELHDLCDMGIGQQVVVGAFLEEILTRGIDELHFRVRLAAWRARGSFTAIVVP